MAERRQYAGGAAETTLFSAISAGATTVTLAAATGWPDGTVGPSFAVIDPGLSTEEKIKFANRSGTALNSVSRGQDSTAAVGHDAGAVIRHVWVAADADLVNKHAADTSIDDHTQYLSNTRHDVTARHAVGAVVPAAATTASLGASSGGSANSVSRGDHVHDFPAWTVYTPSWTAATTNPGIGNGTLTGRYLLVGKMCFIRLQMVAGSSTNFGSGAWKFGLPPGVTPHADILQMLHAEISVGVKGIPAIASVTNAGPGITVSSIDDSPVTLQWFALSPTYPQAWSSATLDNLAVSGFFEVA